MHSVILQHDLLVSCSQLACRSDAVGNFCEGVHRRVALASLHAWHADLLLTLFRQ